MQCPRCGENVSGEQNYCEACGKALGSESVEGIVGRGFSSELKSLSLVIDLFALNIPFFLAAYLMALFLPFWVKNLVSTTVWAVIVLVVFAAYNWWLFKRRKDKPSFLLFRRNE